MAYTLQNAPVILPPVYMGAQTAPPPQTASSSAILQPSTSLALPGSNNIVSFTRADHPPEKETPIIIQPLQGALNNGQPVQVKISVGALYKALTSAILSAALTIGAIGLAGAGVFAHIKKKEEDQLKTKAAKEAEAQEKWIKQKAMMASFDDIIAPSASVQALIDKYRSLPNYIRDGIPLPTGALLQGPPGTGKTSFAHAAYGEILKSGLDCDFIETTGADLSPQMYQGTDTMAVNKLIEQIEEKLNKNKQNKDVFEQGIFENNDNYIFLFIDEIEKFAGNRMQEGANPATNGLNTLMTYLEKRKGRIILMCATNQDTSKIDPAFRRRIMDTGIFANPENANQRKAVLDHHLNKRRHPVHEKVKTTEISKNQHTANFSHADLASLVEAAEQVMSQMNEKIITWTHIEKALDNLKPKVKDRMKAQENKEPRIFYGI